tara:strand:+ start:176 stop:412 length:237 start_codon:yes stop_codon:yes gene_type:complete
MAIAISKKTKINYFQELIFNSISFKVIFFDSQDHARNGYHAKVSPKLKTLALYFLIYRAKNVRLYDTYQYKLFDLDKD